MNKKFNIQNNGTVQGQCIGDNQTVVSNYYKNFICPHCDKPAWEQFVNGVQKCPLCHEEVNPKGE